MSVETLKAEFLKLSDDEQSEFRSFILSILEEDDDFELTEEQKAQLDQRWNDIEMGKVVTLSAEEVDAEIMNRYGLKN